jgi:nucleotide-binding universal stress UspA family protein
VTGAHTDPVKPIIEAGDDIDADRIVMTGHKQTPVGKVVFGSVTQAVLLGADRPVTVVMV